MATEGALTIDGLDASQPLSGSVLAEGDDHLRMIKAVLKNQFQNWPVDGVDYDALLALVTDLDARMDAIELAIGFPLGANTVVRMDGSQNVTVTGKVTAGDIQSNTKVKALSSLEGASGVLTGDLSVANVNSSANVTAINFLGKSGEVSSVSVSGDITAFNGTE